MLMRDGRATRSQMMRRRDTRRLLLSLRGRTSQRPANQALPDVAVRRRQHQVSPTITRYVLRHLRSVYFRMPRAGPVIRLRCAMI